MSRRKESAKQTAFRALTGRSPVILDRPARLQVAAIQRRNKKATDASLARDLGVSTRTLKSWKSGKSQPSKANRAKLTNAVRVNIIGRRKEPTGKVTIGATVQIGTKEPARGRRMTIPDVPASKIAALKAAVASGDEKAVYTALTEIVRTHTGQSADYSVSVTNLTFLAVS
jgi:DNA-binding transcriptional regulator YiaG